MGDDPDEPEPAADIDALADEVAAAREEVATVREALDERAVDRSDVESSLRRYVRRRQRRGHARGWGPYLVLLYGVLMTLGAFYWLSDPAPWAAVTAMLVIWTSTLGVYVLMVVFGWGIGLVRGLGRIRDAVGRRIE
jgi:membrane protein